MEGINQGLFSFPGVESWESFKFTDVAGISPAIGVLTMFPQFGFPDENGDIVLTYSDADRGQQTITIPDCQIDAIFVERNSGGQTWSVRFMDERWTWAFGEITGRYNIRLPDNWVNPRHEKTPQELATLCFEAMGVDNFDVSALPNDARPDVDWDHDNPAQELQKLCDDLGCRIVPVRSKQLWKICVTGDGADLPPQNQFPYNDAGEGVDPKEKPDFIKIVTAPIQYQVALPLEAVGRDTDHSWKGLAALSYTPINFDWNFDFGLGLDYQTFSLVDPERALQADGTAISPQELALQTVYRCWRIEQPFDGSLFNLGGKPIGIDIPGYDGPAPFRRQIILSDQLVQTYVDERGDEHRRPAIVWGQFLAEKSEYGGLTSLGTRIDFQGLQYKISEEERASFSLAIDPIDTSRSIITISKPMVKPVTKDLVSGFSAAELFFTCAVQVRDADTWQPTRFEYLYQIGEGDNEDFCYEVIKDEIQPWYIQDYNSDGTPDGDPTDNQDIVNQQCSYFAKSYAKTFEVIQTGTRTYLGLYPIDMDGAINQVTYRIGKQGSDTIASRGTEHDFDIPPYEERLQRTARKGASARLEYLRNKLARQERMRGTFNTI